MTRARARGERRGASCPRRGVGRAERLLREEVTGGAMAMRAPSRTTRRCCGVRRRPRERRRPRACTTCASSSDPAAPARARGPCGRAFRAPATERRSASVALLHARPARLRRRDPSRERVAAGSAGEIVGEESVPRSGFERANEANGVGLRERKHLVRARGKAASGAVIKRREMTTEPGLVPVVRGERRMISASGRSARRDRPTRRCGAQWRGGRRARRRPRVGRAASDAARRLPSRCARRASRGSAVPARAGGERRNVVMARRSRGKRRGRAAVFPIPAPRARRRRATA